jgi:hypothetical protein
LSTVMRFSPKRYSHISRYSLFALALGGAAVACGASGKKPVVGVNAEPWISRPKDHPDTPAAALPLLSDARHALLTEKQGSIGPFFARRAEYTLSAALQPGSDTNFDLVMVPILRGAIPGAPPKTLATITTTPDHLIVRAHSNSAERFLLAYNGTGEQADALYATVVDVDGKVVRKSAEIASSANRFIWMENIPTQGGSIFFYAEEVPGNEAQLFVQPLDETGGFAGPRKRLARGASGWQVRAGAHGMAFAWAQSTPQGHQILVQRLSMSGEFIGIPTPMHSVGTSAKVGGSGNLDIAFDGKNYVVAWTDDAKRIPAVTYAFLDENGKASEPIRAAEGTFGAELVSLAVSGDTTALAWEVPGEGAQDGRYMHTAIVGSKGLGAARYSFAAEGTGSPQFVASAAGFAWLTSKFDKPQGDSAGVSERRLVKLTRTLTPTSNRVVTGKDAAPVALAWNLDCQLEPCRLLYAEGEREVTVYGADLVDEQAAAAAAALSPAVSAATGPSAMPIATLTPARAAAPATAPKTAPSAAAPRVQPTPIVPTATATTSAPANPPSAQPATVPANSPASEPALRTNAPDTRAPTTLVIPGDEESIAPMTTALLPERSSILLESVHIASISATRQASTTYVATLSAAADVPNAPRGSTHATLTVFPVSDNGAAVAPPFIVSTRARALSGVSIAAAPDPRNPIAVAWVAREEGDPQVHLTKLDRDGRRLSDQLLTQVAGDARDVCIVPAPDGFLVVWVDGRDGNGEVYAARVDYDLKRVTRDERITRARGDAFQLSVHTAGDLAFVTYIDTRDSPSGDVYLASISTRNAARVGDEVRVTQSLATKIAPRFALSGANLRMFYGEKTSNGPARAYSAQVTARGALGGAPTAFALPAGFEYLGTQTDQTREETALIAARDTGGRVHGLALSAAGDAGAEQFNIMQPTHKRPGFAFVRGTFFVADRSGLGRVVSLPISSP